MDGMAPSDGEDLEIIITKFEHLGNTDIKENDLGTPGSILYQNQPNPFSSETIIAYKLDRVGHVEIGIFNIHGQLIKLLVNETQVKGNHQLTWGGTNESGQVVESGIYFCRLQTPINAVTRRLVFQR